MSMLEALQKAIESAGGQSELGRRIGVKQQTIHYWVTTAVPHNNSITSRLAEVITRALVNALDRGILPLGEQLLLGLAWHE